MLPWGPPQKREKYSFEFLWYMEYNFAQKIDFKESREKIYAHVLHLFHKENILWAEKTFFHFDTKV